VLLRKGTNLLLTKVTSPGESWGFHVDVRDVRGRAPKGVTVCHRPPAGTAAKS